ncbi:MAG: 3,4-dihydroxy 2-butanone 4-phosphate synthase / GTP cyclohydrolase II [Parcubacteria group bacterium Gr01-1014_31]|nr:MAG: 3,4-dihydroxy 2-butanone 4-phosphate synthase / GTP cyclohydrolase II [Parcubacteria group bacterium Gr01-1014_31]
MFTGIIRYQGKLTKHVGNELTIAEPHVVSARLKPGGSVAVNGVCLTVEARSKKQGVRVSVMPTTARSTTLGSLPDGSRVNLELPLRIGDPLDGHLVSGHVDGVGTVKDIQRRGNSRLVTIAAPRALARYLAPKGSVAIDGVSLTIQSSRGTTFTVGLIPETMQRSTLGILRAGSRVNLEIDMVARYLDTLKK